MRPFYVADYYIVDTHRRGSKERLFEYALVRNGETGEARGIFKVPKSPYYSVKMKPGKYFGLNWVRMDWKVFTDKELEEISESQFETYKEFAGLKEFKIKKHPDIPQGRFIMSGMIFASLGSFLNAGLIWLGVYVMNPASIIIPYGMMATGFCIWAVVSYRVATEWAYTSEK